MGKTSLHSKYTVLILCAIAIVVLLSATYFITREGQPNHSDLPKDAMVDDFNFKLNFSTFGKQQIDTYEGTYTKDLVIDGTKTIDFRMPDNVKNEIYKLMMGMDILSFPDTLKVDGVKVDPSCDYKLTVTIKGKTKNIIWNEGFHTSMTNDLPEDHVNFLKLVKYISDYIYSTEEYKSMPKAKGGYL